MILRLSQECLRKLCDITSVQVMPQNLQRRITPPHGSYSTGWRIRHWVRRVKIAGPLLPQPHLWCTTAKSVIPDLRLKLESQGLSNPFSTLGPRCVHPHLCTCLQAAEKTSAALGERIYTQIKAILLFKQSKCKLLLKSVGYGLASRTSLFRLIGFSPITTGWQNSSNILLMLWCSTLHA